MLTADKVEGQKCQPWCWPSKTTANSVGWQ